MKGDKHQKAEKVTKSFLLAFRGRLIIQYSFTKNKMSVFLPAMSRLWLRAFLSQSGKLQYPTTSICLC